jgi:hypothetical protein
VVAFNTVAFPWTRVSVDVFLIERRTYQMYPASELKNTFLQIYMPLMGYRHAEYFGAQDDIYVRNGLRI